MTIGPKDGLPILPFPSGDDFAGWLQEHYADTPGIWLQMYKKHTGRPTVVWAEAVEAALRFGWIDSVVNTYDADSYIQRFTPRRARRMAVFIDLLEQGRKPV